MKRKIFLFFVLVGLLIFFPFTFVRAQSDDSNSITNYEVGECVENKGQVWQQLADGTWATENSDLNSCNSNSLLGWLGSDEYNPWLSEGLNDEDNWLDILNQRRIGYYPWGNNYPGGYDNYNDYFLNCVVSQSLVSRPECRMYPKISDFYLNPYGRGDSLTVASVVDGTYISAEIPLSKKISSTVKSIAMGWTLGQLFN